MGMKSAPCCGKKRKGWEKGADADRKGGSKTTVHSGQRAAPNTDRSKLNRRKEKREAATGCKGQWAAEWGRKEGDRSRNG